MRFIDAADFHLREDVPRCRIDSDWMKTQEEILFFIANKANENDCPVAICGDVFNRPTVSAKVVIMFLVFSEMVKRGVYLIAGNHDLFGHSIKEMNRSSIGIVTVSNNYNVHHLNLLGKASHFDGEMSGPDNGIMFIHQLVFPSVKDLPPNTKALCAQDMLDLYPDAKWIFVGDYHKAFYYEKDGRFVVNPGCITRQAADFKSYRPQVYYVDTDKEIIDPIILPETADVVVDDYLRTEEERETRISSFIESIRMPDHIGFDFYDNVKVELDNNKKVSKTTRKKIMELLEVQDEG